LATVDGNTAIDSSPSIYLLSIYHCNLHCKCANK
jgi:hypothetical protein